MHRRIVFAFAFVFLVAFSPSGFSFNASDPTGNYTFAIGDTITTYTLTANVSFGNVVNTTNVTTVRFLLPSGIVPNAVSACNATNGWAGFNATYSSCMVNVTSNNTDTANYSLVIKLNQSAFSSNPAVAGARPAHGWLGPIAPFITASCTTGCGSGVSTSSMLRYGVHANSNPRPYFVNGSGTTLSNNVSIQYWNQTDAFYVIQLPVMTFNTTSMQPEYQNNSFGEVMYFDKGGQMEMPNYMRMYSYSLNFTFLDTANGSIFTLYNPVNTTTSPCTITFGDCPSESVMPLLTQTNSFFDPITNQSSSFTISVPSPDGYDLYVNGTRRSVNFSSSNETAYWGLNASFVPGMQQNSQGIFTIAVRDAEIAESTNYTLYFTVTNQTDTGGGSLIPTSPIYVVNQSISGWNVDSPPPFGENLSISYIGWVRNALQNWTLYNASVRYFIPTNATRRTPTNSSEFQTCSYDGGANLSTNCTFNMTSDMNFSWWNSTGWLNAAPAYNQSNCVVFNDNRPGEESGGNFTVCFVYFTLPITHSNFNNWNPNSTASIAGINFSATISFPVMDETDAPEGTAGEENQYNVTFQASMQTNMNLTDKVPNIENAGCDATTITLDGSALTCDTNFTIGSLTLNSISQGSHTLSVSYTPSSSGGSSGGGSSSGGGGPGCGAGGCSGSLTPSPSPTPQPSIEKKIIDSSSSVVANFGSTGVTFDLVFEADEDGFYGDLTWRLPFEYSEYALGQVRIAPEPESVKKGSIIAVWKNVDLKPGQEFKVKISVTRLLDKSILEQFTSPVLKVKAKPAATASASPAPSPIEPVRTALQPDYTLLVAVIAGVLVAAYYFGVVRKKKQGL